MSRYYKDTSDCFGRAMMDYYIGSFHAPLVLHNTYGSPEEVPLEGYFYTVEELPEPDVFALSLCRGRVLDIGAAAGRHANALSHMGLDVTAMDISGYCCEIMEKKGVRNIIQGDIFAYQDGTYGSALLLTNGIGLVGDLDGYVLLLQRLKQLISKGGRVIFDSSDIAYLYEKGLPYDNVYYGIMQYRYEYLGEWGSDFRWLYIDRHTARRLAEANGWHFETVYTDETDAYLAVLTNKS